MQPTENADPGPGEASALPAQGLPTQRPGPSAAPTSTPAETIIRGEEVRRRCGQYELLGELGRGGMGVVYRGRHTALDKIVAVKVISIGPGTPEDAVQRFRREAKVVASLRHPGIIAVHDYGVEGDAHFFVMDFLDGKPMDDWLAGRPALDAIIGAAEKVARAVHYAHGKGILHRDLKPANVMMTGELEPVVLDFGLAKPLVEGEGGGLTQAGSVFGTPNYMAPEQAAGMTKLTGPHTDVYALGAILYQAVAGRPPHTGENIAEILARIIREEPAPPSDYAPDLPRPLEAIILKAMAHHPSGRYTSAEELAEDLRRFREGAAVQAQPPSAVRRLAAGARRRPRLVAALAVVLIAAPIAAFAIHARLGSNPVADSTAGPLGNASGAAPGSGPATPPGPSGGPAPTPGSTHPAATPPGLERGSEADPDRLVEGLVREARDGRPGDWKALERRLAGLGNLPTDQVREWDARLEAAARSAAGSSAQAPLDALLAQVRAELAERLEKLRDRALQEALEHEAAGDLRRALARLERFSEQYPKLAEDPKLVAALKSTHDAAADAARTLERSLVQAAADGTIVARREEFDRAVALLPEDEARRLRDRMADPAAGGDSAPTDAAAGSGITPPGTTDPAATGGTDPATPDPAATTGGADPPTPDPSATAGTAIPASPADEAERFRALRVSVDEGLFGRSSGWVADLVQEAIDAGTLPSHTATLGALVRALRRITSVEDQAWQHLGTLPSGMLELAFFQPSSGEFVAHRVRVLRVEETPEKGRVLRFTSEGGSEAEQPFSALDAASIVRLARLAASSGRGAPVSVELERLIQFAYGDYGVGKQLLDERRGERDLLDWMRMRLEAHCREQVQSLRGFVEARDLSNCRWCVEYLDSMGPLGLSPEESGTLEEARRLIATEDGSSGGNE